MFEGVAETELATDALSDEVTVKELLGQPLRDGTEYFELYTRFCSSEDESSKNAVTTELTFVSLVIHQDATTPETEFDSVPQPVTAAHSLVEKLDLL